MFVALGMSGIVVDGAFLQIVGGKSHGRYLNGRVDFNRTFEDPSEESQWTNLDADLYHWTKTLRPIQV